MSIEIMTMAWKVEDLSPMQKLVLVKLADNANDSGVCWPSISTIAKQCCCSNRTVIRAIDDLQGKGHLLKEPRNNTSNVYTINPCHKVTTPLSQSHPTPCHKVTQTVIGNVNESSDKSSLLANTVSASDFIKRFNEVSPKKCRDFTRERITKFKARIKSKFFAQSLDELFKRIKGSAFLQGENDRGWQMDIDWLLANDTNYVKILEGKYDNSRFKKPEADEGPQQPDARIAPKELKGWQDFVTAQCKAGEYDPERLEEFLSGGWDRLPPYIKSEFRDFQTQ